MKVLLRQLSNVYSSQSEERYKQKKWECESKRFKTHRLLALMLLVLVKHLELFLFIMEFVSVVKLSRKRTRDI